MVLPDNWKLFKHFVLEKIRTYCNARIWSFDYDSFTAWLSNFDDPLDEYMGLHLLDSLIVRSNVMAVSGYSRFLTADLRQHLIEHGHLAKDKSIAEWDSMLRRGALLQKIRFTPVRLKDDHGESGSTIYRLMSRQLNTDRLAGQVVAEDIADHVLILIDDFIGGGEQFSTYADEIDLGSLLKNNHVVYAPLMAYQKGMATIGQKYPDLAILPVETIDESHNFFSANPKTGLFRNDTENSVDEAKQHYGRMRQKYGPAMPFWSGKDEAGLSLAFQWGCPNQTMSILWMEFSTARTDWQQLFSRRA